MKNLTQFIAAIIHNLQNGIFIRGFFLSISLLVFSPSDAQWIDTLAYNDNYRFFTPTAGNGTDARIGLVNDSIIITDVRFLGRQNMPSQVAYMTYHKPDGNLLKVVGIPEIGSIQYKPSRAHNMHFRHHGYMIRTEDAFPPFEEATSGFVTYQNDSLLWTNEIGKLSFFSNTNSETDSAVWMRNYYDDFVKINLLNGNILDTLLKDSLVAQVFPKKPLQTQSLVAYSVTQKGDSIYAVVSGWELDSNFAIKEHTAIACMDLNDLNVIDMQLVDPYWGNKAVSPTDYSYYKSLVSVDSIDSTYTILFTEHSLADNSLMDSFSYQQNYTKSRFPAGLISARFAAYTYISGNYLLCFEIIMVPRPNRPDSKKTATRIHLFKRDSHQLLYSLDFDYGDDFINNYLTQVELSEDGSVFAIMNVSSTESQFALIKIDTTGNYSLSDADFEAHKEQDKLAHFYPNPLVDELQMTLSESGDYEFRLYTPNGKLVMECDYKNVKTISISASSMTPGFYIYQLIQKDSGKLIQMGKLIKR